MTNHVLLGLTKLRADLIAEHDKVKGRLVAIGSELGHLDAVMRMLDSAHRLPVVDASGLTAIAKGERSKALLDVMREAGAQSERRGLWG